MRERIHLAWLALRGQLRGGIHIAPLDEKAKFSIEHCYIESRVGDVPLISMPPNWPDSETKGET